MCASTTGLTGTVLLFDVPWETYEGLVDALPEHRMRHTYQDGTLELFDNLLFHVPWDAYEKILKAFGDRRFPHTYQDGTLEIMMSPSERHEQIKTLLGRMIEAASIEYGYSIRCIGSSTRRHKKLMQGLEPDESYYIQRPPARGKRQVLPKKTAPDLVVEVDLRHVDLNRIASFAKLGVREVWRYSKGSVEFFCITSRKKLKTSANSLAFPAISARDVTRFVKQLDDNDDNAVFLDFVAWLRKHRE